MQTVASASPSCVYPAPALDVGACRVAFPDVVRDTERFPGVLEPRRMAGTALAAVIQDAYVHGASTRAVDDLVQAMRAGVVSKSQVSRLCGELGERVDAVLNRPIRGAAAMPPTPAYGSTPPTSKCARTAASSRLPPPSPSASTPMDGARPSPAPKQNRTARHQARPAALPGDEPA